MLVEMAKIPLRHGRDALREIRSELRQLGAASKLKGADRLQLAQLTRLLMAGGFSDVRRVQWRRSDHPELANLETRPDFGDLILEAVAP